ncbi:MULTISPECIES: hypothetical protein [Paenibacillus]|uniref:hypothetical protein n=1 Tax=Paenibacillus TaxID=44249 RepID=UPI002FDF37D1
MTGPAITATGELIGQNIVNIATPFFLAAYCHHQAQPEGSTDWPQILTEAIAAISSFQGKTEF